MKNMVIGISPNYNYPNSLDEWKKDNTYYASNHGGSLIVRSIMKQYNADYIDDFSDINYLRNNYDTCFLGLATHAHQSRDISKYVNLLEKLDIKTVVLSLGVQDYFNSTTTVYKLHPSVIRLLEIASSSTRWIGVRGPYTAYILKQNGFKRTVPIGCPSLFWNLSSQIELNVKNNYNKPLIVYHRTLATIKNEQIDGLPLLGQDFQDEALFSNNLTSDIRLNNSNNKFYNKVYNKEDVLKRIKRNGYFTRSFDEWFNIISQHDFVFGPRLHGCVAALIQGIPALLTTRDLRTLEIVEFFRLPYINYEDLDKYTLEQITRKAQYDCFYEIFKHRFNNYLSFIEENKLNSSFEETSLYNYQYHADDIQTFTYLSSIKISQLNMLDSNKKNKKVRNKFKRLLKKVLRLIMN